MTSRADGASTNDRRDSLGDRGFTLVEILIAIVLVGILAAVVVVGIGNLTEKGSSAACAASLDAANVGAAVYFTESGSFPDTLAQMTTGDPPSLVVPSGVDVNTEVVGGAAVGTIATGSGWTLTITPGSDGAAPTFRCTATGADSSTQAVGTTACPGAYAGWVGEYYNNRTFTGDPGPTLCRDDAVLAFSWGYDAPGDRMPGNEFSVRWTRTVTFAAGETTFTVTSDDGARLFVDGALLFDDWKEHPAESSKVTTTLTAGAHTVVLEYFENGGLAQVGLSWK